MKQKIFITQEEFYKLYIIENKSYGELAKIFNCSPASLCVLAKKYNIKKEKTAISKSKDNTCLQMYGTTTPLACPTVRAKIEATNLERYGTKTPGESPLIKEKTKNTNLERYGVESIMQNPIFVEKVKATNLSKYGVSNVSHLPITIEKIKQTNLQRYGVETPSQNIEIRTKMVNTWQDRYGKTSSEGRQKIQSQYKETSLLRYGVPNVMILKEYQDKVKNTLLNNHDTKSSSTAKLSLEIREIIEDPVRLEEYILSFKPRSAKLLAQNLGYSYTSFLKKCQQYGLSYLLEGATLAESEVKEFLEQIGVLTGKTRQVIPPKEIDLYTSEHNVGIEYNGNYWHNEERLGKNYHLNKSKQAEEKGVFLYHIFEYEWLDEKKQERIKNQLRNLFGKNEYTIYARKCEIKEVEVKEKNLFLEANHVQGKDNSSIKLGLYYNNELVSLMTFCKPRFNKNYMWELSRFCSKANTNVVGGASKLFKHFRKHYEGSTISYSDIAKTKGTLYEKLGFSLLRESKPNYVWVKGQDIKTRYQCQMKKEKQIMTEQGYYQVFDCGNKVWVIE